ncbi:hydantoinase B/oxoprolinase family protein [Bacillus sp. 1P10SD]|uniref:hydantoinase B/oxoprolinase family protein n=1 Tax=Bacillus sp. 1P10SD TaxID=3132265 RepID=UPI0039A58062
MTESLINRNILIRDLTDAEFQEKYGCDRFTAMVISTKLRYIVEHMCSGLLTTAFSVILRDWFDFAATISGSPQQDYPMPACSNSLILFSGTMPEAIRNTVEEFGRDNLEPGDVLIANDPYRIGTHVNDVCFIRPIFYNVNGEDQLVSFVNLQAHMLDMGGVVPAGFSGTKKNVYENGLVIGPQLLYHKDIPCKQSWNLIFDNARFGSTMKPDMMSIYENLKLGEKLIIETIDRYGLKAYLGAIQYGVDISAESMQRSIENIPDGVYEGEDYIDCDGMDDSEEFRVRTKIIVKGGRMEVDLSGSSRQARTSINCGYLDAKCAVAVALQFLLDPNSRFSSGGMRNIDLVLPDATIVSAMPPDGAIMMYFEASALILHSIYRALKDVLGENAVAGDVFSLNLHNANGRWPDGTPWVTSAQCGGEHGAWGGTKAGDGDSYSVVPLCNSLDPAIEAIEMEIPAIVLRKEYVADTAGAGQHRGGASVLKDTLWLTEADHYSMPLHFKRPSGFGVNGGKDGCSGAVWMWDPDHLNIRKPEQFFEINQETYAKSTPIAGILDPNTKKLDTNGKYFYYAKNPVWHTKPNSFFRYLINSGGGWGNPLERDPDKVKNDVRDEYVTIEGAMADYGVVIIGDPLKDPEGLMVDFEATKQLRAARS